MALEGGHAREAVEDLTGFVAVAICASRTYLFLDLEESPAYMPCPTYSI